VALCQWDLQRQTISRWRHPLANEPQELSLSTDPSRPKLQAIRRVLPACPTHLSPTTDAMSTSPPGQNKKGSSQRDCRQGWRAAPCWHPSQNHRTFCCRSNTAPSISWTVSPQFVQSVSHTSVPTYLDAAVHQQRAQFQDVEQRSDQQAHVQDLKGGLGQKGRLQ